MKKIWNGLHGYSNSAPSVIKQQKPNEEAQKRIMVERNSGKTNLSDEEIPRQLSANRFPHPNISDHHLQVVATTPPRIRAEIRANHVEYRNASSLVPKYRKYHLKILRIVLILRETAVREKYKDKFAHFELTGPHEQPAPSESYGFGSEPSNTLPPCFELLTRFDNARNQYSRRFKQDFQSGFPFQSTYLALQKPLVVRLNSEENHVITYGEFSDVLNRVHIKERDFGPV